MQQTIAGKLVFSCDRMACDAQVVFPSLPPATIYVRRAQLLRAGWDLPYGNNQRTNHFCPCCAAQFAKSINAKECA